MQLILKCLWNSGGLVAVNIECITLQPAVEWMSKIWLFVKRAADQPLKSHKSHIFGSLDARQASLKIRKKFGASLH